MNKAQTLDQKIRLQGIQARVRQSTSRRASAMRRDLAEARCDDAPERTDPYLRPPGFRAATK